MNTLLWQQIVYALSREAVGTLWRIPAHMIEHPRAGQLTPTFGAALGQRASFRARLSDGGTVCVEDHTSYYEVHIERPVPRIERPTRLPNEHTGTVLGMTAFGALLGLAFGRTEKSALTGALIGGIAGLSGVAVAEAASNPNQSAVALQLVQTLARVAATKGDRPPTRGAAPAKALPLSSATPPLTRRARRKRRAARA